jgi:membrane-associated protease RseP (regulator of RpoE activity)
MFTKYSVAASFAVLTALGSTVWAAQEPNSTDATVRDPNFSKAAAVVGRQPGGGPTGQPDPKPGGDLASAMANFMVRTGLVVTPDAEGQIVVEHIRPESNAAQAGIKTGDIVTSVNGKEANGMRMLQEFLTAHPNKSAFEVGFRRGSHTFSQPLGRQISLIGMTIFPDSADRPVVYSVQPDSPAATAGIRRGDVITAVADRTTDTMAGFMNFSILFVRSLRQGQSMAVRLVRNGNPLTVSVVRPKDSELEPLTPPEQRILDRQAGVLSTTTQEPARPMEPAAAKTPRDLTSVVAVLYGPSQQATVGSVRGTVGYVMVQISVPAPQSVNPPGTVTAIPQTNTSIQPTGSIINPNNPSTVPYLGPPNNAAPLTAGNFNATLTAKLSGLPEGQYALVVGQYGDCADLGAVAMQQVAARVGTIQVHANGEGSLNVPIAFAPRDFLARVVAVIAPTVPGTGNVAAAQATATTGSTITTGIWGCGIFHLANPRRPLSADYPGNRVSPRSGAVAAPVTPAPSVPVPPPAPPVPVQP